MGNTPELFPTLYGLWLFYYVGAEHRRARELAGQLLDLATSRGDTALLLEAHFANGNSSFCLGEFASARTHIEHGVSLYDSREHHALALSYGSYDPGVGCLCYTASARWFLGYPDQALKSSRDAVALARELGHPFSLVYALLFAAMFHQWRQEADIVEDLAEAGTALAIEEGSPFWEAWGSMLRGWGLARQGQGEEGIREGLTAWQATGSDVFRSYYLGVLAEAYGQAGRIEEGLTTLAEALAFVEKTDERFAEAELHRLNGELLLQQSDLNAPAAETSFQQALTVARSQQARLWELRAAARLARLWQQQGRRAEAHALLADVYNWFTEGFDTKDLQDAKALLEALE
jgi:predicted ATPase